MAGTWKVTIAPLGVLIAMATPTRAQEAAIVIEARNSAGVPETVLADAADRVRAMYQTAGVAASWENGIAAERTARPVLTVIIAHGAARKEVAEDAFGLALEPGVGVGGGCGHIAYAFWDRIAGYARRFRLEMSVVLAAVIAHETGHLVLPQYSHSMRTSVMTAHWRTNDFIQARRENMRFSDAEAARMHEQIRRCSPPNGGRLAEAENLVANVR